MREERKVTRYIAIEKKIQQGREV